MIGELQGWKVGGFFSPFAHWPSQNTGGESSELSTFGCARSLHFSVASLSLSLCLLE